MGLSIEVEGQKILSRGKNYTIPVTEWPQINGQPVHKSLCYYDGTQIIKVKTNTMILNDYKIQKRDELKTIIKENWLDIDKTYDQIKTQWSSFKSAVIAANTKEEIDTLFDNAYTWLGL